MPAKNETFACVKIILLRTNTPDDVLTLTPNTDDEHYTATFVQNTIGNVTTGSVRTSRLFEYLENFLRSSIIDKEGPEFFQFDVPMFPTVIVRREDVMNYVDLLCDQIDSIERSWPVEHILRAY